MHQPLSSAYYPLAHDVSLCTCMHIPRFDVRYADEVGKAVERHPNGRGASSIKLMDRDLRGELIETCVLS